MTKQLVCLTLLGCFGLFQIVSGQTNTVSLKNSTCMHPDCSCCLNNVTCPCNDQCKPGHHGGSCNNDCPITCVTCNDPFNPNDSIFLHGVANCTSCKPGYYSTAEYFQCKLKCPYKCATCSSVTNCTSCKAGYTGDKCDQCAPNFQTYPECNQCMAGFYGTDCNQYCPVNCNDTLCEMQSGHCTNGCNENFTGVNCTSCIAGLHGLICDRKCPVNCYGDTCNQTDGYCLSCKSNFIGETCGSCINGQYGSNCDFSCPSNCSESKCNRTTGNCDSCRDGLSGDKCCMKGTDCQSCLSDSVCSECVPGKHGDQCGKTCPERCANKNCYKLNGTCISCLVGFHGDTCTIASTGPSFPVAAVTGGVIGGLVVIIIGIVLLIFFKRRSSHNHKNENTTSMAQADVSTTIESVYANDTVFTAASNESMTYESLAKTSDTITDYEPLNFGASLRKGETRQLSTEKTGVTNKLGALMKSDKKDKLNNSPRPGKHVKPEMAVNSCKPHKAAKVSKSPPKSVEDNDYYNSETSLKKSVPVIDLES